MAYRVRTGLLLIADMGGYTEYLEATELSHARVVVSELLDTVIDAAGEAFEVAKIEGDAIFFTASDPLAFVEAIGRVFGQFHSRLSSITSTSSCTCRGCACACKLTLKFVAHWGAFGEHTVHGLRELIGTDIVLVHRLLKNTVPLEEYVAVTPSLRQRLGGSVPFSCVRHVEHYEHVGEVEVEVWDLAPLQPSGASVVSGNPAPRRDPRTALLLCGGGSRGAAEVGLMRAMSDRSIRTDLIVGTSIGAVNGAFSAAGVALPELQRLWHEFEHVKPIRLNREIFFKGARADSILDTRGLERFLEKRLPVRTFEELRIPLTIVATDLQTGEPVLFEHGDLLFPIMASIALPLYFPPRLLHGHQLVDGGVTSNVPLDVAVAKGAQRVITMLCRCRLELERPISGMFGIQNRAFEVAIRRQLPATVERIGSSADLLIIEPCLASARGVLDFRGSRAIIEEGYREARAAIESRAAAWRLSPLQGGKRAREEC